MSGSFFFSTWYPAGHSHTADTLHFQSLDILVTVISLVRGPRAPRARHPTVDPASQWPGERSTKLEECGGVSWSGERFFSSVRKSTCTPAHTCTRMIQVDDLDVWGTGVASGSFRSLGFKHQACWENHTLTILDGIWPLRATVDDDSSQTQWNMRPENESTVSTKPQNTSAIKKK